MSAKHSYTTADYLPWDVAMNLVRRLYNDGKIRLSLLIGCGCFFGLRISDLRTISWAQILGADEFVIVEHKTEKRRVIRVNMGYQKHIQDCYESLKIKNINEPCFLNRFGNIMSIQMINRELKIMKVKYRLPINNISTHTLRKTWARAVWENENSAGRGEMALLKLSECLNHSAPNITRRYIGLRQQEISEVYNCLQF